jgi:enamine deaminase RidA (YjgF/YER057c/UK114 family)
VQRIYRVTGEERTISVRNRLLESESAAEVFITATPDRRESASAQAQALFQAVRDGLESNRARILQERIFASESALPAVLAARSRMLGPLDDGVPPTLLRVPEDRFGPVPGVFVHAVRAAAPPEPLRHKGAACGRIVEADGFRFVALSGLTAPQAGPSDAQAKAMFETAQACLGEVGATMRHVARTWLWLGDILAWYDDLNRVRNQFFGSCGLLDGDPNVPHLPASTGIGVYPAGGAACALDAVAVIGPKGRVEYFREAGNQRSPYHYGSAFSRAARASTPAGHTVYVSGTAAIDRAGNTNPVGDVRGQVHVTVENVRAALKDLGCSDAEVVQALVYSKTPQVQETFHRDYAGLEWPCVSVIADLCRDDLLFEAEATACPGARNA